MSTEALADALEKALRTEDSHLAVRRLTGLASGELDIISALHPDQIKVYVKVFCDVSVPAVRRRWIGLILCRLLDSDFDVMQGQTTPRANPIRFSQKIQKEPKPKTQFSQLGQILISGTELEETKIIAGLIIRQELRKGVDYDTLWSSDEVPSAAPLFPLGNGLDWIQSFQSYLDHLSNLRLMERPASDATILYPISLKTDDGFRWRDPEPVMALSILESVALTVITPDAQLKQFNFVEIPLQFILIIEKTQSVLQASQNSSDEHRPWDLTLKLPVNAFTYSLNGRRCRARKIVITFQSREDATECENSIVEWQEDNGYGLLDFPSQMRHDKTAKEDTGAASDVEMHTTPGSQVSIQQATDDIVKDIAVLHNPPGSQTIIEQATDDIIKATAELQNLPGSHGSIQQANKDIFDAIVRLRAAQRSHDSIRLAIHEIVEAIPQLGIIALATEGFMQQGTGDIVEGRVLRQLDGNYSEEEPVANATDFEPWHGNASNQRALRRTTDNTGQSRTVSAPDGLQQDVCSGASAANTDGTKGSPNKSQRKGQKRNALASIKKPKASKGNTPAEQEDEFAFPDEDLSTGDVRMPPTGSSARGKQQTAGAKSKPKSSQPKTKSLAKGRGRPRKSGKENARPSPPPTSDPSVSKDTTKALKRRRQSEEKDVNIVNMSSDLEPEPRKTRRAAKKVTYTEEGTSDNSDDSDFVATEPKNNNKPAKDTTRRNVCLSIKGGINVDIRTTKSKDDISSELQSMSPTKDNRVPFLSSKSRPDDRFSPKCGENVDFKARKSEVDEISSEPPVSLDSHSAAPPVSKILHNRNTTEHTPASPSAHALEQAVTQHSSHFEGYRVSKVERKTLDRLNDISDDLEEDGHPPVDEAVSKFDITPEKIEIPDDWSVIQEMLAVPASEGSRMALATVSKKRPAPPTPVYSPKAKRHKGDLLAEPLTTIAPPKILEDPNSPCPQTRVRQAAYMRPKVTAAKALNKEMEVRQQDRSGHDYGLTREATHNRAPAEVWTPTAHGIQRTSSDDSEAMLLLSSNSKPLPAPPTAESTAISGHSSRGELNVKEMNVGKASEENPFLRDTASVKAKSFVGRLTTSMQHSMKPGVQELVSVKKATTALLERDTRSEAAHDLDGDTLISEEHGRATNAFPILVKSSPPKALFSPSSHSSTSAQGEADRHAQYVFNPSPSQQELEDREWENSLKPHQRTIGAQLTRISRRVLRHIVDNETAVNDVAQTYAADAYTLFDRAQARRNEQFEAAVEEIKKSAGEVRMRLVWLAGKIRAEREGSARGM